MSRADLADAVNQLTRPRRHVEKFTRTVIQPATRTTKKRTQERRNHTVTLPPLLEALVQAMVPGVVDTSSSGAASFESRPPADLEPVAVLRDITNDTAKWCRTLGVERTSLVDRLRGLVSADMTVDQLDEVTQAAKRWVKRARQATGFDPMPITIGDPCPTCARRHALTISGDLTHARCGRCGADWDINTIGLFAEMLRANQQQDTVVNGRCYWRHCARIGPHDDHLDQNTGRSWRDWCDVPAATG